MTKDEKRNKRNKNRSPRLAEKPTPKLGNSRIRGGRDNSVDWDDEGGSGSSGSGSSDTGSSDGGCGE